jgi:pilus assembly protein FimV
MSRKLVLLGLLSLILAPGAALSLGLGEIRLGSYLNQPMNADIGLTLGSRAELDTLRVELAPADAFARYGLERPAFLDDLRFQVRATGATSAVVNVTSSRPITEPFVTFLVEARWSGGRVLREYTVLLDPPTFLPAPEAAPAPPPAVDAPRPAPVERPGQEPVPVMTPTPVATPAPAAFAEGADFGPVQRNDTLWAIAQRVRPDAGLTTNQVMVALFRANPGAFDGNINRLRAGAILRVPSRADMAAASSAEATAEVRRQNEAWRGPAAPVERRLELAPPTEAPRPAAPAADPVGDPAAASPQLVEAVEQLRGELADTRRLMEVKDAEIAALQARLAELESEGVPVPPPVAVEPAPVEATPPVPEPAPAPAPEVVTPTPAPVPVVAPPSLLDRVGALLGSMWLWLALAGALILAAVVVFLRKRKDEARSIEDELAETGSWAAMGDTGKAKAAAAGAAIVPRARPESPDTILVEETSPPADRAAPEAKLRPVPAPAPAPEAALQPGGEEAYRYPFEDTIAGETGINLDQADPLAEADFHMAYGLYDQAAEIIKKAVEREPDRYDLRRKLIDICFVWGNADEFLKQAKAVRELGGEGQAADWAKVSIMGRQICPGEPMFAAGAAAAVDVDLAATHGDASGTADSLSTSGQWLDFDVGESDEPMLVALGDTNEQPAPGTRRSIDQTAELDLEELGIEFDLGESGEHALKDLGALADEEEFTGTTRLTDPPRFGLADDSAAAEQGDDALDEQDEDGNTLLMDVSTAPGNDPTREGEGLDLSGDDPTLSGITRIDEDGLGDETLMGEARVPEDGDPTLTGFGAFSSEGYETDRTREAPYTPSDSSPTMESGALGDELDLDLDELTQAMEFDLADQDEQARVDDDATMMAPTLKPGETPSFGASSIDEGDTREMAPPEVNEIGTKLDLARAYIDMGDTEGARSILGEVVEEGDEAQQEEARQLLDSLD